jgi:hypothetical protein
MPFSEVAVPPDVGSDDELHDPLARVSIVVPELPTATHEPVAGQETAYGRKDQLSSDAVHEPEESTSMSGLLSDRSKPRE